MTFQGRLINSTRNCEFRMTDPHASSIARQLVKCTIARGGDSKVKHRSLRGITFAPTDSDLRHAESRRSQHEGN